MGDQEAKGMEDLRHNPDDSPEEEEARRQKVLKSVRSAVQWDFMRTLTSLPDNPFYKKDEKPDKPSEPEQVDMGPTIHDTMEL